MDDEEYDYFAWAKTGHLNLTFGTVFGAFWLLALVVAVDAQDTGAIVLFSLLLLGALIGVVRGLRELRAYRARGKA